MTNGEKIQKDFKGCEVCEPIVEDDIIHVIFADKKDSAIGFDWSWWNAEYKGQLPKNDLGVDCISREQALRELKESAEHHANDSREEVLLKRDRDIIRALPPVTPKEPREITFEDVKGYCKPRFLTIITNELYHELTHPKIKALEQEPVLDKVYAEIEELQRAMLYASKVEFNDIYKILDKHKGK